MLLTIGFLYLATPRQSYATCVGFGITLPVLNYIVDTNCIIDIATPFGVFPSPSPTYSPAQAPCKTITNGECAYYASAIGDIPTDADAIVNTIFTIILGISGGVAMILIVISGYTLLFSQGDPEKLKGARETLTSAIVGLLFIIFSTAILEFIGVNILHIPGLGH